MQKGRLIQFFSFSIILFDERGLEASSLLLRNGLAFIYGMPQIELMQN